MTNRNQTLGQFDADIAENIAKESTRQIEHIELIASENYVSKAVLEAQGSVLTNKYAEGYPGRRFYGGCDFVDNIESLAIARAKQLFGADYANVQPHSGSQANAAAYLALCKHGDTILGMSLNDGGHLTHGAKPNFSGKIYNAVHYGRNYETMDIDYQQVEKLAFEHKPKVIVAGFSAFSGIADWQKFREIADKVGAFLLVDMAHVSGLVAAGVYPSPVPFADVVTSTTHKTLRGPRSGIILAKANPEIEKKLNSAVFPGSQGGPLCHVIAAKAVAFKEALSPEYKQYQQQVVKNADTMAKQFYKNGYGIVGGETQNHLMCVDLSHKQYSGNDASNILESANITLNKNNIPNDPKPPTKSSGIRLGTPAITTRGFTEADCIEVTNWICAILDTIGTDAEQSTVAEVKAKALELCYKRPIYK